MLRLPSTVAALSAAFVLAGLASPALAQPAEPGCASPIDDLSKLVNELDGVLGATGAGTGAAAAYGSLGGHLDRDVVAANVAALSGDQRRALAGQLLTVALDPTLTANASGDEAYEGFQNAYNLGKNLSLWDAASKIDHDRGVTKETIEYIKSKLG